MHQRQLIHFLQSADGSVGKLNNQLALLAGYQRLANPDPDAQKKALWYDPSFFEIQKMPDFTGSIDEATRLLNMIVRVEAAGFAIKTDGVYAQVNDEPPIRGATPALALCAAAVQSKLAST